jgi:hypothetical protein
VEDPVLDEALHVQGVTSKQYHKSMESEGGGTRALSAMEEQERETLSVGDSGAEETRLRLGMPKMGGKASIYKGRWKERQNVSLDPRDYHVPSSRHSRNHAHATPGRSLEGHARMMVHPPNGS